MVDWPIFVLGLVAVSIVMTAVRAIAREDLDARTTTGARTPSAATDAPPAERRRPSS